MRLVATLAFFATLAACATTSFPGALPCADCPGTHHVVELHPDNVFVSHIAYLGRDTSYDDIGRRSFPYA